MMLEMMEKKADTDVIDWLVIGMYFAKAAEEETAYQCFHMAHLLDHQNVSTNAELKFDT